MFNEIKYTTKARLPYNILEVFKIKTVEGGNEDYARVKFLYSRATQIVTLEQAKTGEFLDEATFAELESTEDVVNDFKVEANETLEELMSETLQEYKLINTVTDEEFIVTDLNQFAEANELSLEALELILEGKQKTHKRWTIEEI